MLDSRSHEKRQYFQGRSVLVTGATGLLGSHLTQSLLDLGCATIALVRDRPPLSPFFLWGLDTRATVVRGDVTDLPLLRRMMAEYEVEVVFHLAAQTIVTHAKENPPETFHVNLMGTVHVLEAVRGCGRDVRVLIASSDKAYGDASGQPAIEETPLQPRHPYDASKAAADLAAAAYAKTYGMRVAVTRCANLYGGGDLNWNRLVPGTIRSALRGQRPVVRSNGLLVRDFLYVKDAVLAYLTLAYALVDPAISGQAFNFSNEDPRPVLAVVHEILRVAGRGDLAPEILGQAQDEIPEQRLSSAKAHLLLGFTPRLSLAEGLRETLDWYKSYLGAA